MSTEKKPKATTEFVTVLAILSIGFLVIGHFILGNPMLLVMGVISAFVTFIGAIYLIFNEEIYHE